jgi:hypothetical protein
MLGTPAQTITTEEGFVYEPWSDGWAVGYKVTSRSGRVRYLYLNPSGASDDGCAVVFVYANDGTDPLPFADHPLHHYTLMAWEED